MLASPLAGYKFVGTYLKKQTAPQSCDFWFICYTIWEAFSPDLSGGFYTRSLMTTTVAPIMRNINPPFAQECNQ